MDAAFLKKMNELYQDFKNFDELQTDRLTRYRNIEPESAQYLAMLIRIQQSKNVLEIGTSTGYSTLWLADAVNTTQGQITTLEIDAERSSQARQHAIDFGLHHLIDFWVGDAKGFLSSTAQKYDLILLDAERDAYIEYWSDLQHLIHPQHGVLIVDNVISHAEQVQDFIRLVDSDKRFITTTLAIGAGLFMVVAGDDKIDPIRSSDLIYIHS